MKPSIIFLDDGGVLESGTHARLDVFLSRDSEFRGIVGYSQAHLLAHLS